jgi:hypothetical protein
MLVTTAVDAFICRFSGNFFRDLDETFVLTDHAQFEAGALLDGVIALLQVADLGVEARVPDFQLLGHFLLLLQLTVVLPDLQPAALAQPQRVLQQGDEGEEADRQPAHARSADQRRL